MRQRIWTPHVSTSFCENICTILFSANSHTAWEILFWNQKINYTVDTIVITLWWVGLVCHYCFLYFTPAADLNPSQRKLARKHCKVSPGNAVQIHRVYRVSMRGLKARDTHVLRHQHGVEFQLSKSVKTKLQKSSYSLFSTKMFLSLYICCFIVINKPHLYSVVP